MYRQHNTLEYFKNMKKLMILIIWLSLSLPSTSATANKFVQTTNQLHKSKKLNYVDTEIGNTLNLYKISTTDSSTKKLYNPLNIQISQTKNLTLRERRALKKAQFFQSRRQRSFRRKAKKFDFYQERRRKKFKNQLYLWRWFQKTQNQPINKAIS